MDGAPLLIELGTEELPPKALPELAQAFYAGVLGALRDRAIGVEEAYGDASGKALYSPRRLAVFLPWVAKEQPTLQHEALGPAVNIALDASGNPTPALVGFAKKQGVEVAALEKSADGSRFVARTTKPGATTASVLAAIVADALKALPIPKPMRWGSHDFSFVRPVHWLVMLHGDQIVDGEVLGLRSSRMSRGHRFHHPDAVGIVRPEEYVETLRNAFVLVDPDERRACVRTEIEAAAQRADGVARIPEALLEEVNCLVEWPRAVLCGFEPAFLRVPQEALISTMEVNQKFFPVLNRAHRLTERFIGIANIDSRDVAEVRKGYERVIRPRFADAQFFFDEDRKQGLAAMAEGLANVTYQQKLGSYADKTARMAELAAGIADRIGVDETAARRAAALSKADLQSRLVGEFPELQGIAGRYYASAAGEMGEVADAIDHAYLPRMAGDAISPSRLGQVLALAERLDTLAGGFTVGLKPTGNKDPFALRRNALGLARTLIEGNLDLELGALLEQAVALARESVMLQAARRQDEATRQAKADGVEVKAVQSSSTKLPDADALVDELHGFVIDRLRGYYADQGFGPGVFDAVAELRPDSLLDFDRRLRAIAEFAKLPEAQALAAANKRIRNIMRKHEGVISAEIDQSLMSEPAETALFDALNGALGDTDPLLAQRDYVGVLTRLAELRPAVDAFFDKVMVMAEDMAVRGNRLALLKRLADRFATIAAIEALAA